MARRLLVLALGLLIWVALCIAADPDNTTGADTPANSPDIMSMNAGNARMSTSEVTSSEPVRYRVVGAPCYGDESRVMVGIDIQCVNIRPNGGNR
jgi:hypothetical protein